LRSAPHHLLPAACAPPASRHRGGQRIHNFFEGLRRAIDEHGIRSGHHGRHVTAGVALIALLDLTQGHGVVHGRSNRGAGGGEQRDAILRPAWSELERPGRAAEVWHRVGVTFQASVVGPVFEELCRTWALRFADPTTFGGAVQAISRGLVPDAEQRVTHEVEVVVRGEGGKLLAIGEAKWGARVDSREVARLQRIVGLLAARGHDTTDTRITLFAGGGFSPELRARARADRLILVDLDRLYRGA